jgi:hypothetical protein
MLGMKFSSYPALDPATERGMCSQLLRSLVGRVFVHLDIKPLNRTLTNSECESRSQIRVGDYTAMWIAEPRLICCNNRRNSVQIALDECIGLFSSIEDLSPIIGLWTEGVAVRSTQRRTEGLTAESKAWTYDEDAASSDDHDRRQSKGSCGLPILG